MQHLSAIIEKTTRLKARNQRLFAPLLDLSDAELMPYDVSASGLSRSDLRDKIRKIHSCAGLLEYRAVYTPDSAGVLEQNFKIHNGTYCQQYTVCEICSRRVQITRWKRFEKKIEEMVSRFPFVYHVTFTITDRPNLGERIDYLQAAFRAFVRQGQRRGRDRSRGEWSKVGAAIVATENKRGEAKLIDGEWVGGSDLWHVHKHALLFCREKLDFRTYDPTEIRKLEKRYGHRNIPKARMIEAASNIVTWTNPATGTEKKIPVSKLSLEWMIATGGQGVSVKARVLSPGKVAEQAKEVLKYPVKTSLKTNRDIPYILEQIFNHRFLATYGKLRGMAQDTYELTETKDSKEIYLSRWGGYSYSPLAKGSPISYLPDEIKKKLFQRMAVATGAYRRQRAALRRAFSFVKIKVLGDLAADLDRAKLEYKQAIAEIVSHFSRMPDLPNRVMPRYSRSSLPDAVPLMLEF